MQHYTTNDYNIGVGKENEYFKLFCDKFDVNLKTTSKFNLYDYESEDTILELKSRRCSVNTYPTTIIGCNKFKHLNANNESRDAYFAFSFTDGLYYWKYNKDQLNECKTREVCRRDRGRIEKAMYYEIPISYLDKLI